MDEDDAALADASSNGDDVGLGWAETGPPTLDAPPPPPPSACSYAQPSIATDTNGKCSTTETWTCSSDVYALECNCWSQTCECYANGDKMLAFGFPGCPTCTLSPDVIAKCPFPH